MSAHSGGPVALVHDAGARRAGGLGVGAGVAITVIAALLIIAAFGPALAPTDPEAVDLAQAHLGPSGDHLLGTDGQGRDLLSRLLVGARSGLLAPLVVVGVSAVIGTSVAILAAWSGGSVDAGIGALANAIFAFPGVLLAIFAVAVFGTGLTAPVIALTIVYVPYFVRVGRAAALRERSLPYVAALTVQGASPARICGRHILPNVLPIVAAQMVVTFGYAMVELAAISFLGLGVQPPDADWGAMVATGQAGVVAGYPQEALYAALCIVVTVVAFNVLGNRLLERGSRDR